MPDAEMIQKLAQEMEVPVSELLGTLIDQPAEQGDIALQLSRINEQMAIRNRRAARIWKGIGVTLAGVAVILLVLLCLRLNRQEMPAEVVVKLPDTIEIYALNMESGYVDKRIKFSFAPSAANEELTYQVTLRQHNLMGTTTYETVTADYSEGFCHAAFETEYAYGLWFDAVLTVKNGQEERNVVLFEELRYESDGDYGLITTWQ